MTNTRNPFMDLLDAATDKLVREAMETPASEDFPQLSASMWGVVDFASDADEVHLFAAPGALLSRCGVELADDAYGLVDVRPACWICVDGLDAPLVNGSVTA